MAIRQTRYVNIVSGMAQTQRVSRRDLGGRVFTKDVTSGRLKTFAGLSANEQARQAKFWKGTFLENCGGRVVRYSDYDSVLADFGSENCKEVMFAKKYFGFVSKSIKKAKYLTFEYYETKNERLAEITGYSFTDNDRKMIDIETTLDVFRRLKSASFPISMGGREHVLTNLDFTEVDAVVTEPSTHEFETKEEFDEWAATSTNRPGDRVKVEDYEGSTKFFEWYRISNDTLLSAAPTTAKKSRRKSASAETALSATMAGATPTYRWEEISETQYERDFTTVLSVIRKAMGDSEDAVFNAADLSFDDDLTRFVLTFDNTVRKTVRVSDMANTLIVALKLNKDVAVRYEEGLSYADVLSRADNTNDDFGSFTFIDWGHSTTWKHVEYPNTERRDADLENLSVDDKCYVIDINAYYVLKGKTMRMEGDTPVYTGTWESIAKADYYDGFDEGAEEIGDYHNYLTQQDIMSVAALNATYNYKYLFSIGLDDYTLGFNADLDETDIRRQSTFFKDGLMTLEGYSGLALTYGVQSVSEYSVGTENRREGFFLTAFMPMALFATTDYTKSESTKSFMYQKFDGEPYSVDDSATADYLDRLNVNYYGCTLNAGNIISFYQTGHNADGVDTSIYCNEVWLKDAISCELMKTFLNLEKVSASSDGAAVCSSIIFSVINEAVANGTISVEKELSVEDKLYIDTVAGEEGAWKNVYSDGYWYTVNIKNDGSKHYADYVLVYSKGDAIRKVEGSDILV